MPGFSSVGAWFPFTVTPIMQFLVPAEVFEEAGRDYFTKLIESHCGRWLERKLKMHCLYLDCTPVATREYLLMRLIFGVSCLIPVYSLDLV